MNIRSVLVVCMGNICRSPMAEYLLRAALPESKQVSSAGLGALINYPADDHAIALMHQHGIELSAHRARQISASLVAENDLILVMTQRQKEQLEAEFPSARGRVFRYGHWLNADVADPYQQDRAAFESAYALISEATPLWVAKLIK
ncbi:MAG: low molecular weight protein-tyrosine-phosphatase [Pseudomonadota bacterium]